MTTTASANEKRRQKRKISGAFNSVFPLQKGKGTHAFFFVPDIGGSVFYARKFVEAFGPDQPIYGFRLDPRTDWSTSEQNIVSLAQQFAKDLVHSEHPAPYHIVGHSFAGILAHEIARQVDLLGGKVGILAILDASVPPKYNHLTWAEKLTYPVRMINSITRYTSYKLPKMTWGEFIGKAKLRFFGKSVKMSPKGTNLVLSAPGYVTLDLSIHPEAYRDLISHLYKSMISYEPRSYSGDLIIFKSKIRGFFKVSVHHLGWRRFVDGGITVHSIAGEHLDMVHEEHLVSQVTAILAGKLEHP